MNILITGGAGFVGFQMAKLLREKDAAARIVVLDNLKRRGSELNLAALRRLGIEFHHADIREPHDFDEVQGNFDLFLECSAEPSVLAGLNGNPLYSIDTNLGGTINCLEFARKRCERFLFLSTSRVYSIPELQKIPLRNADTRFEMDLTKSLGLGLSDRGLAEDFPLTGYRSIYGTTKLASELLIQEYVHAYGLKAIINRCGVLCGPGQMGKVDQGVFTLWMARHQFGGELTYMGFEGSGFQVRDLLHPKDLFDLVLLQQTKSDRWNGGIYNIGGGNANSVSLKELTTICQEITGRKIKISLTPKTSSVDIPFYVTDSGLAQSVFGWKPKTNVKELMSDIQRWLTTNEENLKPLFQ